MLRPVPVLAVLVIVTGAAFLLFGPQPLPSKAPALEIRTGPFAHDVYEGFLPVLARRWKGFSRPEDEQFGLSAALPDGALGLLGSPRIDTGGTFNTKGYENQAHLAASWRGYLFGSPLFVEGTFGGGLHDGHLLDGQKPDRNMGCRINFYESLSVGVTFWNGWSLAISYEHMSNADLCPPNEGLSNMGFRIIAPIE
ncbi:MAG: acyloxyacyl hydrolase [Hyphomicrobiaceae bacterium]|nr:acyloxyacyl hydrolase [Hyphomicrobiaceae bacterium]MCC0025003.1 acyloxyacyl hydrolase [Hyphomicrobiaceae bacterium]